MYHDVDGCYGGTAGCWGVARFLLSACSLVKSKELQMLIAVII